MGLFRTSLLVVLSCAVMSVQAANWNTGSKSQTDSLPRLSDTNQNLPINFMIPDDVLSDFKKGSDTDRKTFCSSKSKSYVAGISAVASGLIPAPQKIIGFNSRMDNYQRIDHAQEVDEFLNDFVTITTEAWVNDDEEKKSLALDALFYWASNRALLGTKTCAKNGRLDQGCTEWKRKDGQDISDTKDHAFVQMVVMKLAYNYYFSLASFRPSDPKHHAIKKWFSNFFDRNKSPRDVYFGMDMGWYWPAIFVKAHNNEDPSKLISKLLVKLDKLVLDDGALDARTTRGNRALWYHHTAMLEVLVSLEIARKFKIKVPQSLDSRVEKAGQIFIRGYKDHSYMDRWAKKAHNAIYEPGKQDFSRQPLNFIKANNAWLYIFSYRYPDSQLTVELDQIIRSKGNEAISDPLIGFGLGCVYAVAKNGAP